MTVSVIIPYGYRTDWEERLFRVCLDRWTQALPDAEIIVGNDPDAARLLPPCPFNRARARNHGARASTGDVLVFADADSTFISPASVEASIAQAEAGGWNLPAEYLETTQGYAEAVLESGTVDLPDPYQLERHRDRSPGGFQTMPRAAWKEVDGWDENFTGWGWEDAAMRDALDVLWRPHQRVGIVVHLWHPRPADSVADHPGWHEARNRGELYRMVATSADKVGQMRRLTTGARG